MVIIIPSLKWVIEPLQDLQATPGDITPLFRIFDHFASVSLLIYMIYFTWRRYFPYVKFLNCLFRHLTFADFQAIKKYTWFVLLFLINVSAYRLLGTRGLTRCLYKGEYVAQAVSKTFGFNITPNSLFENSLSCFQSKEFYKLSLYFAIKYVTALVTLLALPLYMIQHGIIMSSMFLLRLVWKNLRKQMQQPGLSFDKVISFKKIICQ